MHKIGSIARTEARQLWRSRSFWIVHSILILLPAAQTVFALLSRITAQGENLQVLSTNSFLGRTSLSFYLLLIPVLISPIITRNLEKPGEILWSTPLDPIKYLVGTYCGIWSGLLPGIFIQIAGWWVADLFAPQFFTDWVWFYSLFLFLVVLTISVGLTMALALLLRRSLPVLIAWIVLWVLLNLEITEGLEESFIAAQSRALSNIFFHNISLSPSLGLGPDRSLVIGMCVWFAGVVLVSLCLAFAISLAFDTRKTLRYPWRLTFISGASLIVLVFGWILNQQAVFSHAMVMSPFDIQAEAWHVTDVEMNVQINPNRGVLEGTASLSLRHDQPLEDQQIVLRLNPGLDPEEVTDGEGKRLTVQRQGEGLVIALPAKPEGSVTLHISWSGSLHLAYQQYAVAWRFYDGPFVYQYQAPQPPGALFQNGIGFLLRDGDWYPWPWTVQPHQPDTGQLVIHTTGTTEAFSTAGLVIGEASTWEGILPAVLMVFPPGRQIEAGTASIRLGKLSGDQPIEKLQLYTAESAHLSSILGIDAPTQVFALPYLGNIFWEDQTILIPDGSGYYFPIAYEPLNLIAITSANRAKFQRTIRYALLRTWMFNRIPLIPVPLGRTTATSAKYGNPEDNFTPEAWAQEQGRWVQPPETLDLRFTWTPRRNTFLESQGEFASLAFWMAMELSEPEVIQDDVTLLEYLDSNEGQQLGYGSQYNLINGRLWPYLLESDQARLLIRSLHTWSEKVGGQQAIQWVIQVFRQAQPGSLDAMLPALQQLSGVPVLEERR